MEDTFGRYRIIETLPRSGPGLVHHASDSDFEGEVAIKILPRLYYTDPARRFKFEQEQRILALLENERITPIVEIGEWDGRLYIVMRWMGGGSLADRLAGGPLPPDTAADLFYKIARILQDAHHVGIVHRDLKPENVLFDADGELYLSDFGMLKLAEAVPQGAGGYLAGAPAYASPEEARGESDIDERSDIYALGRLLHHMLTGEAPQAWAGAPPDTGGLPPLFAGVIQRAVHPDRDRRYASVEEMLYELYDLPEPGGEPSAEPLESTAGRQGRAAPARMRFAWAALLALLLAAAGWAAYSGRWPQGNQALRSIPALASLLPQPGSAEPAAAAAPTSAAAALPATSTPAPSPTRPSPTPDRTKVAAVLLADRATRTAAAASAPSATPTFTPTPAPEAVGGAYQLAFLHENDVWLVNLDGSGLERITTDGKPKTQMRWVADGSFLLMRVAGMYSLLDPESGDYTDLGIYADLDVAPDLNRVVLGDMVVHDRQIKKWTNALVEISAAMLRPVKLTVNHPCKFYAGRLSRFSTDGKRLASVVPVTQNGVKYEVIALYELAPCGEEPQQLAYFLGEEQLVRGYNDSRGDRKVYDFAWDGRTRFAFSGKVLNDYGDLFSYDLQTDKYQPLSPVGACCYRFARWSPDGSHLLFAYVDTQLGDQVQVYYQPWEAVLLNSTTGGPRMEPLPLPAYMFEDRLEDFQPALRPLAP